MYNHIPWVSSSPEGKTTLEALAAVNDVLPVRWTPRDAARVVYNIVVGCQADVSGPMDCACSSVYREMDQEFRRYAGIGMDGKI